MKKKKVLNKLFKGIGIISTITAFIFCYFVYSLNMLPDKYLILIFSIIAVAFFVLWIFTLPKKLKIKMKVIAAIFFVLFGIGFCIGSIYINKTIKFIGHIAGNVMQTKEYYLMTLSDSDLNKVEEFKTKKIGIYLSNDLNMENALDKLSQKIEYEEKLYDDTLSMLKELKSKKVDGIFISESIKNMVETEFTDLRIELKEILVISIETEEINVTKSVDVTKSKFNIYIAGGDSYGTIDKITNTDVNMIVSVDPKNKKILLTSIPRDYYINLPSYGKSAYDKLTHAGYYGIDESIAAVENLLDIDINYYLKVNFSAIEGVVDAIDGIDVDNDMAFCITGTKYNCYKRSNIHLTGNQALAFARERMAFSDGDVQRVKNQQKVLSAVIKKVSSSKTIITKYSDILDSISSTFLTNIDSNSIRKLVRMQLNDMSSWSVETQNLVGTDGWANTYTFPKLKLYVMKQDENSVNETRKKINGFLEK